jgi:hypothetical protein
LYDGFAIAVLFVTLGSMLGGFTELLYAMGVVAAVGSGTIGALSVRRGWIAPTPGLQRFAKPWLWMTAFAALSLFNGKWEPMVFFGALAAGASLLYWIGTMVESRR